ncbi:MAG: transposase [Pseudonocardiaceae bacterium]
MNTRSSNKSTLTLKTQPWRICPGGSFAANAAWLTLAAIAHNLTRAAGCLASLFHGTVRTGTLRLHLINLPARIARQSRRITLQLPFNWPHRDAFTGLSTTTRAPQSQALRSVQSALPPEQQAPRKPHKTDADQRAQNHDQRLRTEACRWKHAPDEHAGLPSIRMRVNPRR